MHAFQTVSDQLIPLMAHALVCGWPNVHQTREDPRKRPLPKDELHAGDDNARPGKPAIGVAQLLGRLYSTRP